MVGPALTVDRSCLLGVLGESSISELSHDGGDGAVGCRRKKESALILGVDIVKAVIDSSSLIVNRKRDANQNSVIELSVNASS